VAVAVLAAAALTVVLRGGADPSPLAAVLVLCGSLEQRVLVVALSHPPLPTSVRRRSDC